MKIAILGGGFTGLSAAFYLSKKGHNISIFEKESVLGGLAAGFKKEGWEWYLERAIHHLFTNDYDILNFAKDMGFRGIFFKTPETASLYDSAQIFSRDQLADTQTTDSRKNLAESSKLSIIPLDSPLDLLRFPYLGPMDKVRVGAVLAFLKASPFLPIYEKQTVAEFSKRYMGERAWKVLWEELFRKKFGKYAGIILASFLWARIKKRTKNLGYIKGGFQSFVDSTELELTKNGVIVKKGESVERIEQSRGGFKLFRSGGYEKFDAVISTLPTPVLVRVADGILSKKTISRFSKIKFLHAISLIIESKDKLLDREYWVNVSTPKIDLMGIFQHTNFIDKKHYGGRNILYVGNYVDRDDRRLKMSEKELIDHYIREIRKINSKFEIRNSKFYLFRAPFAQPIFDKDFVKNKPDFLTGIKNFYIANLDMTYPYDRGTNYAVRLGKEVSRFF